MSWQGILVNETQPYYESRKQEFINRELAAGHSHFMAVLRVPMLIDIYAEMDARILDQLRSDLPWGTHER